MLYILFVCCAVRGNFQPEPRAQLEGFSKIDTMGRGNKGKDKEEVVAAEEVAPETAPEEPAEEEYSVEKVMERR